jgi:two-component system OmpR family response regulator
VAAVVLTVATVVNPLQIRRSASIHAARLAVIPTVDAGPVKTILICEDDQNLRQLVRAVLGDGYRFLEAQDGDEAVALALRARPDLIILDLMMPGRSGLDVLNNLRRVLPSEKTRVIVLSAWGHADEAALNAGADRFVPKPFEADELTAIVKDVLQAA